MKLLRILFVVAFVVVLSSCGDGVQKNCKQDDWIGTYEGTLDCDGDMKPVTVTIIASGFANVVIRYVAENVDATYQPQIPNGCNINIFAEQGGLTLTSDISINGDEFNYSEILSDSLGTDTCIITATRQ